MKVMDIRPDVDLPTMLQLLQNNSSEMELAQKELNYLVHSIDTHDTAVHIKNNLEDFLRIYCTNWFVLGMKYGIQMYQALMVKQEDS